MYPDPQLLVHVCPARDWVTILALGRVPVGEAGFVHLSTPQQVHLPANRIFPGRLDLKILVVEPTLQAGPLRWEPGVPGDPASMRFPHLYGPLPVSAVVRTADYLPEADGRFAPFA